MKITEVLTLVAIALSCLVSAGCGNSLADSSNYSDNQISGKITVSGSSTIAPLVGEIAARFEEQYPAVRIDVQSGGSSRGIRDTLQGNVDIGMSSRELKDSELAEIDSTAIGWDGVAFLVSAQNPVSTLTNEQLVSIYTGKVNNWKSLGGNDSPIVVSNRAEGRSEQTLMSSYLGLNPSQIKAHTIDGETQQSIKTVATNRNAIIYTSLGAARFAADNGESVKLLPLNGVPAAISRVQSGEFPLARPLLLMKRGDSRKELVDLFIEFCQSPANDDLVEGLGFVSPQRTVD